MDNENSATSYAGTAFHEHGVTNYSLHYRLYIDKDGQDDEEFKIKMFKPRGNDSEIADRVRRNTYATAMRTIPLKNPARPSETKVPVIANEFGAYQNIGQTAINNMVNRLTVGQTKSTAARHMSTCGSGHLSYHKPQSGILRERRLQRIEDERLAATTEQEGEQGDSAN